MLEVRILWLKLWEVQDGTIYDLRFIELLNKYNLKATLNLNSKLEDFVWYYENHPIKRLNLYNTKNLFTGHEVASHSLTHPYFYSLSKEEILRQVSEDISNLKEIFEYEIEGFAFPFDDQTEEHIQLIKENLKLKYIRYSHLDNNFIHKDRYHIHINALCDDKDIYEKLEEFKTSEIESGLFVIAGHSYEFEVKNDWEKIEKLLSYLHNSDKFVVLTLKEAVRNLFK